MPLDLEVGTRDAESGFGEPRIVPYHPLAIDPSSPCLHYGVQCFEGMKAYKVSQTCACVSRREHVLCFMLLALNMCASVASLYKHWCT